MCPATVIRHCVKAHGLVIGVRTAERLGNALEVAELPLGVQGRDCEDSLPRTVLLTFEDWRAMAAEEDES